MRTLDKVNNNCAYYSTEGMYKDAVKVFEALIDEGVNIKDLKIEETEEIEEFYTD